jgi:hypothetical protein
MYRFIPRVALGAAVLLFLIARHNEEKHESVVSIYDHHNETRHYQPKEKRRQLLS